MGFLSEIVNSGKLGNYSGKGHKCAKAGQYDRAIEYYQKALKLAKEPCEKAPLYELIANVFLEKGEFGNTVSNAKIAKELYSGLGESDVFRSSLARINALIEKAETS